MAGRVSQEVIEAEVIATPSARVSQIILETYVVSPGAVRVSQQVFEVLVEAPGAARVSQEVLEALVSTQRSARVSQIILEILTTRVPFMPPPIYPTLVGLAYDVQWTPTFYNMPTATTVTGADIDLGLAEWPLHDFDLIYNFLRDQFVSGTQEFKTMFGFFLRLQGTLGRFLFRNPDDYKTVGEVIGTTDGTTHLFHPLMRTFGVGENVGVEPIGWLDQTQPINIYLDSVLQDPSTYNVIAEQGCDMQIDFHSTPATGKVITGDYQYYYYCKFPASSATFNKFMDRIWALQKITIHSCRAGA